MGWACVSARWACRVTKSAAFLSYKRVREAQGEVRRDEELEMQEADGIADKATSFSGGQTGAENTGGQMRQVTRHLFLRNMTGR